LPFSPFSPLRVRPPSSHLVRQRHPSYKLLIVTLSFPCCPSSSPSDYPLPGSRYKITLPALFSLLVGVCRSFLDAIFFAFVTVRRTFLQLIAFSFRPAGLLLITAFCANFREAARQASPPSGEFFPSRPPFLEPLDLVRPSTKGTSPSLPDTFDVLRRGPADSPPKDSSWSFSPIFSQQLFYLDFSSPRVSKLPPPPPKT